jgi:hypothetical protein
MTVNRTQIERALRKAGVKHPFVEDCGCAGCNEFYAFGRRTEDSAIMIAFSNDMEPVMLRPAKTRIMSLRPVSTELKKLLKHVEYVLEVSDPVNAKRLILPPREVAKPVVSEPVPAVEPDPNAPIDQTDEGLAARLRVFAAVEMAQVEKAIRQKGKQKRSLSEAGRASLSKHQTERWRKWREQRLIERAARSK